MQTLKFGSKGEDVKKLQSYLKLCVDGIFGKLTEESVKQFEKDNGLNRLVEKMTNNPYFGYIYLPLTERSAVANLANLLD